MESEFESTCAMSCRTLTEGQIRRLHEASLRVLETVGVQFNHDEALQVLRDAGCRLEGKTVRIPNWLVEECIHSAPSDVTIYNRKGEVAMRLTGRNIHFGMGTDLIYSYDLHTGEIRPSVLQDVVNAARVADALPEIDFIASYALPHDVPTNTMYVESFKAEVENSTKPIFFTAAGREDLSVIIEMASAVVGGADILRQRPFLIHYAEPTAPLTHSFGAVEKLFLCADKGVPINYTPGTMLGASAPVTLAGGIVQANAEALSGVVLHQLRAKGAPIISGFALVAMDMQTSVISYASPEFRLANAACADLYHHYGIPMWSTVGSDSHCLDQQAGMEHAFGALHSALDGANLIHDVGYLGQGLVGSPAALVMCDEIISYVRRVVRGFELTPTHMALDIISRVAPGGTYLAEPHTARMFRKEIWRPKYLNRKDPDVWLANGRKSYGEILTQKAIEILEQHQPEPLEPDVLKTISMLAENAAESLANRHFVA